MAEVGNPIAMDNLGNVSVEQLTENVSERLAAVSLKRPAPSPDRNVVRGKTGLNPVASPLAAWGELTHRYIINAARDLALKQSKSPDDPAMLTIIYSLVLILLSYVVLFTMIAFLLGPLRATLILLTLPVGAYWAAYTSHSREKR
jgi:hypothetical protein